MSMAMTGEDWRGEDAVALFDAILSLEDGAEAERFFRDLCTRRELEEMVQRWTVVRRLSAGLHYREISSEIGVSTATITRINQWLQHGTGGYGLVLERLGLVPEEDHT